MVVITAIAPVWPCSLVWVHLALQHTLQSQFSDPSFVSSVPAAQHSLSGNKVT